MPGRSAAEPTVLEKLGRVAAKHPKGAAQVVGVKEYLEDLAKKQTFFRDAAGNSRVGDTGHKWAKVKFGEFTKEAYDEWRAKGGKKLPNQMY